ncbi:MAG: Na/Pi cotransporter family protein [Candidatus Cloacimonetes bacterium]|nr:Na/Pi cotransporter family protein [Candidatus Cloacimonadota bacterium]
MLLMILQIIGSIGVFLFGMKIMSDGLQRSAGHKLQSVLNFMTQNRFMGVMTGVVITSIIQSSSATTVMIVSFVNAGLLSLTQAISTIMGANIGTTITTWIVSYFGFKVQITALALPIVGIGLPFMFAKQKKFRDFGDLITGLGILFIGLGMLRNSVPDITQYPETQAFLIKLSDNGIWSYFLYVAAGTILTMIIQSSSAMMTVTVAMAFKGWIDFPSAAALCLGENIGTTITAYIASIGTTVNARRAARAHTLFNVIGVIWMSFVFVYFNNMLTWIVPWDFYHISNIPINLALFHTLFNLFNTILLVGFVQQLAYIVERLVKPSSRDKDTSYKLQYISTPLQDTADMNIIEAKKEIEKMAMIIVDMFDETMAVFNKPDKKLDERVLKIKDTEALTDQMQVEITAYLQHCAKESLSETNYNNLNFLMRIVHELENIADSIYNISKAIKHKYDKKIQIKTQAHDDIETLTKLTKSFLEKISVNIVGYINADELKKAYDLEASINDFRRSVHKAARSRMQQGEDVRSELLFLDLVKYFEHIGDNCLNIMQALNQLTD